MLSLLSWKIFLCFRSTCTCTKEINFLESLWHCNIVSGWTGFSGKYWYNHYSLEVGVLYYHSKNSISREMESKCHFMSKNLRLIHTYILFLVYFCGFKEKLPWWKRGKNIITTEPEFILTVLYSWKTCICFRDSRDNVAKAIIIREEWNVHRKVEYVESSNEKTHLPGRIKFNYI